MVNSWSKKSVLFVSLLYAVKAAHEAGRDLLVTYLSAHYSLRTISISWLSPEGMRAVIVLVSISISVRTKTWPKATWDEAWFLFPV